MKAVNDPTRLARLPIPPIRHPRVGGLVGGESTFLARYLSSPPVPQSAGAFPAWRSAARASITRLCSAAAAVTVRYAHVTLAKLCMGIVGGAASASQSWTRSPARSRIRAICARISSSKRLEGSSPSSNADELPSRGSKGGGGGGGEAGREGAEGPCTHGRGGTSLAASADDASHGCHSRQSWHILRRVTHGTSRLDRQREQMSGSSSLVSGKRELRLNHSSMEPRS
mmetsp:Transcript_33728/g.108983  ORF Transcript_33728/g.108983 Transcript_33728/m.108983 type:complete len:227 (-) Transcript_33728:640-1320(-)